MIGNQSDQLMSLHGQVTMLKLENETLKEQLQVCTCILNIWSTKQNEVFKHHINQFGKLQTSFKLVVLNAPCLLLTSWLFVGFIHQHSQVNGDLLDAQVDIPTIPLTVYQQLKVVTIFGNMSMHMTKIKPKNVATSLLVLFLPYVILFGKQVKRWWHEYAYLKCFHLPTVRLVSVVMSAPFTKWFNCFAWFHGRVS